MTRYCLILTALAGLTFLISPATGQETESTSEISAPEIFVQVDQIRREIELVRFEMGRPPETRPEIDVSGAAAHEVFFQALTLYRRADRLCFEQSRERPRPVSALPPGKIRPRQISELMNGTREKLLRIKKELGIPEEAEPLEQDPGKTHTDVFRSVVQANRQLNLLLDQPFDPSDVYEEVTVGISYGSALLADFPEAMRFPEPPPFERGKRPADVYERLLDCFNRIRGIAAGAGLEMLELNVDASRLRSVTPGDVYDIAALTVSELAYLHAQLPDAPPPREAWYPGRKFPSHVYQRAGILESQLIQLEEFTEANPNWMEDRGQSS